MALQHDYTMICEFARLEAGGKWTIIGMFPNGIGTPMIPFPLPALTFFQALHTDAKGQYKFTARLTQLITGQMLAQAQGAIQTQQAGPVILPITLGNLQFKAFGTYSWALEIEGQDDGPFVTQFEVSHVPMQLQGPRRT